MKQFGFFGCILVIAVYVLNAIQSSSAAGLALNAPLYGYLNLKKYFIFSVDKVKWDTAYQICTNNFCDLLKIESPAEQDELNEILERKGVGGKDWWTRGKVVYSNKAIIWTWDNFKTPMGPFTSWAEGEPQRTQLGQCLLYSKFKSWQSCSCPDKQLFICTRPARRPRL